MPTPTGLPMVGEVWERVQNLPKPGSNGKEWEVTRTRFVVLERGKGDYWSLRVYVPDATREKRQLWVDPANAFRLGELKYVGPAGPGTRKHLGLPPLPAGQRTRNQQSRHEAIGELAEFLATETTLATSDPAAAASIAVRLVDAGWRRK